MAKTFNFQASAESGGLEEVNDGQLGSPVASSANSYGTGTYAFRLINNENIRFDPFADIADAGGDYIVSFPVSFDDVTPAAANRFFTLRETASIFFELSLEMNGDVLVVDAAASTIRTIKSPFIAGVQHWIEVYIQHTATGTVEVFIDRKSMGADATQDLTDGGTFNRIQLENAASTGITTDFGFVALQSDVASAADRLSNFNIKAYQSTDVGDTDVDDTLAAGTWALVSQTPGVDTAGNVAHYENTGNLSGSTNTDGGTRSGPTGDTDLTGATFKLAKYVANLKRGSGGGRDHTIRYGNSVDGVTATGDLALSGSYTPRTVASSAATVMPLSTESFQQGFAKSATAGQDIFCADQWAMLGFVPAPFAPTALSETDFSDQNQFCGPFEVGTGKYGVYLSPTFDELCVMKTTTASPADGDWSAQDGAISFGLGANALVRSLWTVEDGGNDLHIVTQTAGGKVQYHLFDTGAGTWTVKRETVATIGDTNFGPGVSNRIGCSIAVRADGDVVIAASYNSGTPNFDDRLRFFVRTSGTWANAGAASEDVADKNYLGCVLLGPDPSDDITCVHTNDLDSDVEMSFISSTDTITAAGTAGRFGWWSRYDCWARCYGRECNLCAIPRFQWPNIRWNLDECSIPNTDNSSGCIDQRC